MFDIVELTFEAPWPYPVRLLSLGHFTRFSLKNSIPKQGRTRTSSDTRDRILGPRLKLTV